MKLQVDAEVIRNYNLGYTVKLYVPVPNMASMDKLYFTGATKTQALSKARTVAKANGYKLNFHGI
jgi:hypothetical protein